MIIYEKTLRHHLNCPTFMKNFKPTTLNCRLFKSQVMEELFYILSSLIADEEEEAAAVLGKEESPLNQGFQKFRSKIITK